MNQYDKTVGTRLSVEDRAKLARLCAACQQPPGATLRLLVRLAQPTDLPPVRFAQASTEQRRASK